MLNSEMSAGTKADKNYCCTSVAGQAMLLQMHLLCACFNYFNSKIVVTKIIIKVKSPDKIKILFAIMFGLSSANKSTKSHLFKR